MRSGNLARKDSNSWCAKDWIFERIDSWHYNISNEGDIELEYWKAQKYCLDSFSDPTVAPQLTVASSRYKFLRTAATSSAQ